MSYAMPVSTPPGAVDSRRDDRLWRFPGVGSGLLIGVFAFFFGILIRPLLWRSILSQEDIGGYYFPMGWWYGARLHSGESFLWNPDIFGGFFAHGEGQLGMFHPLHLTSYFLLPAYAAFGLGLVSSCACLALGAYKLFRCWGVSALSAGIGSFLCSFGGYVSLRIGHPDALEVWAQAPWILFFMHRLFGCGDARHRRLYFAAIALLTASQCYGGHPPFMFYSLLLEGWYLLYLVHGEGWKTSAALFIAAKAAGVVTGLAQIVPTVQHANSSNRAAQTYDFLAYGSLHPGELLQWFNPAMSSQVFSGGGSRIETLTFFGSGTLLLAFWWLLRSFGRGGGSRLTKFLAGLAAISFFLCLGRYNGLLTYYYLLPGFSMFRVPARFLVLTHFALSGLAVLAIDSFVGEPTPRRFRGVFMGAAALLAAGAAATICFRAVSPTVLRGLLALAFPKLTLALAGGAMVAVTSGVFCWAAASRTVKARRMAILAMVLELLVFFGRSYWRFPVSEYRDVTSFGALPPLGPPGPVSDTRWNDSLIIRGYRLCTGYSAMVPQSRLGVPSTAFESLMGARAIRREFGDAWVAAVNRPVPRIRLVSRLRVQPANHIDLSAVDPSLEAVVESSLYVSPDATGSAAMISDKPGRIEIETNSTGTMAGFLTERYHESWRATEAGRIQNALRVDGDMLGFIVQPGKQRIVLEFKPAGLEGLVWLGCGMGLFLLICLATGFMGGRNRLPA